MGGGRNIGVGRALFLAMAIFGRFRKSGLARWVPRELLHQKPQATTRNNQARTTRNPQIATPSRQAWATINSHERSRPDHQVHTTKNGHGHPRYATEQVRPETAINSNTDTSSPHGQKQPQPARRNTKPPSTPHHKQPRQATRNHPAWTTRRNNKQSLEPTKDAHQKQPWKAARHYQGRTTRKNHKRLPQTTNCEPLDAMKNNYYQQELITQDYKLYAAKKIRKNRVITIQTIIWWKKSQWQRIIILTT